MFKKIFDLDPNEVENFIKDLVKERRKRGLEPEEYEQWLKDYKIEVRWHPTYDEFYVQIEPNITTEDYKHWYFHSDKELTAGEYFKLAFDHEHLYFREIYGLMTGEPICYTSYDCVDPNCDGYSFILNKKYSYIIFNKIEEKWYLEEYDEETEKSKLTEIVGDTDWIETCISDYGNNRRKYTA